MYTREQLEQYPYFQKRIEGRRVTDVLDQLTGLVSRRYMIEFVHDLIDQNIPFTYGMIDLDNFKYINDTYGHAVGDGVLSSVADELITILGDFGIAGRFGGDEYLFVNFRDRTYEEKKKFCLKIYTEFTVLRKSYSIGKYSLFVTGTTGLATFPEDARDYDTLFSLIDKTLYRGKSKGRNCYIIYVESKHKNIEIRQFKKHSQYDIIRNMTAAFDSSPLLKGKIQAIYQALAADMNLSDIYYVDRSGLMRSIRDNRVIGNAEDIGQIVKDDVYATNNMEELRAVCPRFYETAAACEFETLLASELRIGPMRFGYIMFAEPRNMRIWQDEELVIMYSLARMLSGFMAGTRSSLDELAHT